MLHIAHPFFVALNAIILVFTVCLCSITIPLLVQDVKTKKVTRNFLLSLCVSDLVRVVLGSGFLIRTGCGGLKLLDATCGYEASLFGTSLVASLLVTVVTSVDRYFAVGYPIKYQTIMKETTSYIVIGLNWIAVVLLGSLFVVFQIPREEVLKKTANDLDAKSCVFIHLAIQQEFLLSFAFGLILPSIIILILTNIRIYFIVKRVHATTSKRNSWFSFVLWTKAHFDNETSPEQKTTKGPLRRREIRATIILSLTVFNFVVVWTPVFCFRMAQVYGLIDCSDTYETLIYTIYTLLHIYSVVNPFLYIFTIKHHKQAFMKLLARVFCCNSEVATFEFSQTEKEIT